MTERASPVSEAQKRQIVGALPEAAALNLMSVNNNRIFSQLSDAVALFEKPITL